MKRPDLSEEDQALLDKMRAKREESRKRYAEKGPPRPLSADSPIGKKWEQDEFLPRVGESDQPSNMLEPITEQDVASVLRRLGSEDPRARVSGLRAAETGQYVDDRILAACEGLLDDSTITLLGLPYHYGEVRWCAADAVAVLRASLGRPSPVILEGVLEPVVEVRKLAEAAGIEMAPGGGIEASIATLRQLAELGKLPRRTITR
jgi:hypothetical protein